MRNRILSLTRNTIPYVKEIQPLAGSVTGCILMQQLDYWFERYPDGFYKFQEAAPGHPLYREGESWIEELGFGLTEFRGAFDRIGVRYKSKAEFKAAPDPFQGKFYCCYTDRRAGVTYYFRNHPRMDAALDQLITAGTKPAPPQSAPPSVPFQVKDLPKPPVYSQKPAQITVGAESSFPVNEDIAFTGNQNPSFPVNDGTKSPVNKNVSRPTNAITSSVGDDGLAPAGMGGPQSLEVAKPDPVYAETTVSKTTKALPQQQQPVGIHAPEKRSGDLSGNLEDLVFPQGTSDVERNAVLALLTNCPAQHRQEILDEVEGARANGRLRLGVVPFTRHLVQAVELGTFTCTLGIAVQAARAAKQRNAHAIQVAQEKLAMKSAADYTEAELATLPKAIRENMLRLRQQGQLGNSAP